MSRGLRTAVLGWLLLAGATSLDAQADSVARPAASASHVQAAEALVRVADLQALMEKSTETMIQAQLQQSPQMRPFEDILRAFMTEQLDWKIMGPEIVQLYVDVFTESELRQITAFYETPLGRMMMTRMPDLMARSAAATQARLQRSMPQLVQRIMARAQELEPAGAP